MNAPRPPRPRAGGTHGGPRLFQRDGLAPGAVVALDESGARHVAALRLARDDRITLFDGSGDEYVATLVDTGKRAAAKVLERRPVDRESPLAVTLVQGICAADRMDLVIQKATELGVHAIQPVVTTRTVIRLSGDRRERREQHWQAVAIAACEQCGRNRVPLVHASLKLVDWLGALASEPAAGEARIQLAPGAALGIGELAAPASVVLAVGPEGGFDEEERDLLASRGFSAVRLGPRVLRTETAPLAAIAAMQCLWGDWRGDEAAPA